MKTLLAAASLLVTASLSAQGGDVITAHSSAVYDALLDPNGDGFITASGAAFTSGTSEAAEFEAVPNSVNGWVEIFDVSEAGSDVTPSCSNVDIVADTDGGSIGFWNIVDATPAAPTSGDEYILLRMRVGGEPGGNFGYNFVLSTDGLYGASVDPNALAGNQGFEYEVQFSSGGGSKGVSGWDVDGLATNGTTNCAQCIALADVQIARPAAAGGCDQLTAAFLTVPLPLVHVGIGSDVAVADLFIALATASSGNSTSILGGGNVKDYGAFNDDTPPTACAGSSGAALFDCLMDESFATQQTAVPVTLVRFAASAKTHHNVVTWETAAEINLDHFAVERASATGSWETIATEGARGSGRAHTTYLIEDATAAALSYYRLKSVDLDGTTAYSATVAVQREGATGSLSIAPNPAREFTTVEVGASGIGTYRVYDALGRVQLSGDFDGASAVSLDLSRLPAGSYALAVQQAGTRRVGHIVKR